MALFRRRRHDATGSDQEARPASATAASPVPVAGWDGDLPQPHRRVTVVVVSRSDRHETVPLAVASARQAFGSDADVRAVAYVADASPVGEQQRGMPWVRPDPVDGIASAINAGVAAGVGRVLVVVDSTVGVTDQDLQVLAEAGVAGVVQARVRMADGAQRNGALLLRPGALPWTDDGSRDGPPVDRPLAERAAFADTIPTDEVFAADQPVIAMPRAALVPAPGLPDERMTLTAWTRAAADRIDGPVRVVWTVGRSAEAGRTIDAATVDASSAWRDRPVDGDGVVTAGPPLPPWGARTVAPGGARRDGEALAWSLKTAAPAGPDGDGWGDVHFAAELAAALERLGQHVRIDRRDAHVRDDDAADDVTLVIRGLDRVPPNPASINLLWVISHPDDVADTELRSFDAVFAAGPVWADAAARRAGVPVGLLLQATDPTVFHPGARSSSSPDADRVVFVGSTRGAARPLVAEAAGLGADLTVHGPGWEGVLPAETLGEPFLGRAEVATAYASARVVLNDHWPDMAAGGFVSNRVFDVLAAGGVVVTDRVAGLADVLEVPTLAVADTPDRLAALLDGAHAWPGADARAAVAARIAAEHSFDARARVLLDTALTERRRRFPA
ncbi:glycosyltransferase [Curtobacterium sp. MCLR17_007]|uniref:glycosyltransferase family protein n=1 Tax=Curtobacterium sp. MCLR17_007 TaxID=2175648 RepID=UPI000DA82B6F|nr:glycosyltransferase [Curtobacterium sp. MCLR17_007]WIB59088.1 glycosyltransferase [Curtobacterium sp. MCLR17_007]